MILAKDLGDKLVCASWNGNGKTLAAINRSQDVCLIDPRSSSPLIGVKILSVLIKIIDVFWVWKKFFCLFLADWF